MSMSFVIPFDDAQDARVSRLKVKEAEAEAKEIIENAQNKARKMLEDAERNAQIECDSFEDAVRQDYKSRVETVRQNAQNIIAQNKAEDEKKYSTNKRLAQLRMNDAVKTVLQGVMSECQ